jgi:hypothetical protein
MFQSRNDACHHTSLNGPIGTSLFNIAVFETRKTY